MGTYTRGEMARNKVEKSWQDYLEIARRHSREYADVNLIEYPEALSFRRGWLEISLVYYDLAFGLCFDEQNRKGIDEEKRGIEALLKELEGKNVTANP